ncbi:MAG: hypothetical protein AAF927_03645 [Bacteroidota bacterium]
MKIFRTPLAIKLISTVCIFLMFFPATGISPLYGLTSGPNQPEFSSFEPVATTNMVNDFTGEFTYNLPVVEIPGPDGSGYALSLSYHSGASPEAEASWVGAGWTLNPGAIVRNKAGLPDDFNGEKVTHHNDVPRNLTVNGGMVAGDMEIFGFDAVTLGLNASLQYNNYKGFRHVAGVGFSVMGMSNLGFSVASDASTTFNYNINPAGILNKIKDEKRPVDEKIKDLTKLEKVKKWAKENKKAIAVGTASTLSGSSRFGSSYGLYSANWAPRPTKVSSYTGVAFNVIGSTELSTPPPIGAEIGFTGGVSIQSPLKKEDITSFGYLYSGQAGSNSIMDYYLEKDFPFQKRDQFLSIPFSNPDRFQVMGEGLGGTFRAHSKKAGHFFPNANSSATAIYNINLEIQAGGNIGLGTDLGQGIQTLESGSWQADNHSYNFLSIDKTEDEAFYFRFYNDLGGNVLFDNAKPGPLKAEVVNKEPVVPTTVSSNASFDPYNETQQKGRSGRSSYIGFNTNREMTDTANPYQSYTKDQATKDLMPDNERNNIPDGIGEFVMHNEDGYSYTFGLPVYARAERSMQYGFKEVPTNGIKENFLIHADTDNAGNIHSKVGEESLKPYATSYLLTSIVSPDYIDRTLDGPSEDDFGGYTHFTYEQQHGALSADWFRWRIPYNGLYYQAGELSNPKDDMGSFLSGEKEIYYLNKIETKTHFALFHTSPRADGREAADNTTADQNEIAAGTDSLLKLDKIELFAKPVETGTTPRKLRTIHFEYDYSLMAKPSGGTSLPNSIAPSQGRLTLKKVYTEYENVYSVRTSPYEFEYEYPDFSNYPVKYQHLGDEYPFSPEDQNPPYSPFHLDPWGNYQHNGANRYREMRPWVNQSPDILHFDPAAWQLKQIILPSGGRIDIQYEQHNYLYVQDRRAMAMVRLKDYDDATGRYYLDIDSDLGPHNSNELYELRSLIQKAFFDKDDRIYFKFLYALLGNQASIHNNCLSDFISGYARVKSVGVDQNGLYIDLSTLGHSLPKDVCKDYVKKERSGNLSPLGNCDPAEGLDGTQSPKDMVMNLLGLIGQAIPGGDCKTLDPEHSYFRIPVLKPKRGGGIRVKRLLMFDKGLDGVPVLFGKEFVYEGVDEKTHKRTSSGVATNEPSKIREENSLITDLQKRTDQGWFEKAIAGPDITQFEGPIGETLLPGASIGYRQIIEKDIHSGETNPGFRIKRFYTAYDYPFDKSYAGFSGVDQTELNEGHKEWVNIPAGLFNYSKTNLWLTQGFSFVQTDFHGKPWTTQTYSGSYTNINNPNLITLTASSEYQYFQPGDEIPIAQGEDMGDISMEIPGREMELIFEGKKTIDIADDLAVETDASVGLFGPIPIPFATAVPSYSYQESKLHTHVTTKITQMPSILKRVISNQDGIYTTTEHIAFSPENCRPLLTRTYDGYHNLNLNQSNQHKGVYHSFLYAAADQYPALRQKAINEGREFAGLNYQISGNSQYLICYNSSQAALFSQGDMVSVKANNQVKLFNVDQISGNIVLLQAHSGTANVIIGNASVDVQILQSGRKNRLNEDAGNLVVYGSSINTQIINGPPSITISQIARTNFVNFLNLLIQTGATGTFYFTNTPNAGLKIYGPNEGICDCESFEINVQNTSAPAQTEITVACVSDPGYDFSMTIDRSPNPSMDFFTINSQFSTHTLDYNLSTANGPDPEKQFYVFCNSDTLHGEDKLLISKVIDVNVSTYSDNWELPPLDLVNYSLNNPALNDFESAARGQWRSKAQYVYRENIIHGNDNPMDASDDQNRIYKNAGTFTMEVFNWTNPLNNNTEKWLKLNETTVYSPHGQALEEKNIRNIYSAAKYGYNHQIPYLIAQNSNYNAVYFESFENVYPNSRLEEFIPVGSHTISDTAHSGKKSLRLKVMDFNVQQPAFTSIFGFKSFVITNQIKSQGIRAQVWVRCKTPDFSTIDKFYLPLVGAGVSPPTFEPVARVGEWQLYEAIVAPSQFSNNNVGDLVSPQLYFIYKNFPVIYTANGKVLKDEIWIDDLRMQPFDAQMNCYVYDPTTYRLLTSFDDQHFGLFYQYNAEGKLIRKIVETERGMKTVQETQYNTPTKPK